VCGTVKSGVIFTVASLCMEAGEAGSPLLVLWVLPSSGAHYCENDPASGQNTHTTQKPKTKSKNKKKLNNMLETMLYVVR